MICVDSSVAAKWFFPEEHAALASALLRTTLEAAEPLIAPPLLLSEVTNIIRQRMRQGQISREQARTILAQFLAVPIALQAPEGLFDRVLTLADDYNLPAVYDAHYIVLAEMTGATLWTADQRLVRVIGGRLPFVRSIIDYGRE